MSIVIGILVFCIIILVHEIGHFLAARKCGVFIEEFAIGMGPKIFSTRRGETLYTIRLFPIGGFCKMLGDEGEGESNDPRSLNNKKVWQRIVIVTAGAALNFALAIVLFSLITMATGMALPVVEKTVEGSPAEGAGLLPGDRIVKINNSQVNSYDDLFFALETSNGSPVEVSIMRDGNIIQKSIVPFQSPEDGRYRLGFSMESKVGLLYNGQESVQRVNLLDCIVSGFSQIFFYIKITILGIIRLFTMQMSIQEMSGPIGVVTVLDEVYQKTIVQSVMTTVLTISNFVALMSANVGVFNLLPLPALDGGRLVFLIIEGIRKKPVNQEKEGFVHLVGFVLLMVLAVVIAYNDIIKIL